MLKEHAKAVERVIIAVDLVLVAASFFVADALTGRLPTAVLLQRYGPFLGFAPFAWLALLRYAGFYRSLRTREWFFMVLRIAQTTVLAGILTAALLFLSAPGFSRLLFAAHLALAFAFLVAWKSLIVTLQRLLRRKGYNFRRILLVGTGEHADRFIRHVEEHQHWGYRVVGCVQGNRSETKRACCGYPVLGRVDDLLEICKKQPVDEVIFSLPRDYHSMVETMLPRLEAMGITVRLSLDVYRPRQSRTMFGYLGDDDPIPVVTYYRMTLDPTQLLLKRLLDLAGSAVGLLVLAASFPFVALAIKRDSPGPIFFKQQRVGQNGRVFNLYKFRTMYVDAEERKKELLEKNEMKGAIFKIADDPRITKVGKLLRKTSIDELPQFWNVLRGEMSLVGTRPPTPDEVARYEDWQRARISIKPGLTGMWQTSGRNKVDDFDKICHLDMAYIDNWSLTLDVKLLAKTFAVVLLGVGAR